MTPEFRLLTQLCRRAFADRAADVAERVDWPLFLKLARTHRVEGVAAKGLDSAIPDPVQAELQRDAVRIAGLNLRSAAEAGRIAAAFADAGVPLLFVKGLTLGQLAYGDLSTKSAIDIDLLIAPADLGRAGQLLTSCGWKAVVPAGNSARLERWHRTHKESIWANAERGLQADLHIRLAENDRLIPSIDVTSPSQLVEVTPGIALPTLATEELYAYLAVHGAWSAWFRLKWISDLAALLAHSTAAEIEHFHRRAEELSAGRASAQALLLADWLYGTLDNSPALRNELLTKPARRRLVRIAQRYLGRSTEPLEPTDRRLGTLPMHYSHLLLLPGALPKAGEILRQSRQTLADRAA